MDNYKFLKKGAFESLSKFEKRLNSEASVGWKAIGFTSDHGQSVVLLERSR